VHLERIGHVLWRTTIYTEKTLAVERSRQGELASVNGRVTGKSVGKKCLLSREQAGCNRRKETVGGKESDPVHPRPSVDPSGNAESVKGSPPVREGPARREMRSANGFRNSYRTPGGTLTEGKVSQQKQHTDILHRGIGKSRPYTIETKGSPGGGTAIIRGWDGCALTRDPE